MLNKITFLITLLIFNFYGSQSRLGNSEIVCKYYVEFCKDTLNASNTTSEIMSLQIGKGISLYKSNQKIVSDSIKKSIFKSSSRNLKLTGAMSLDFSNVPKVHIRHEVLYVNNKIKIYDKLLKNYYKYDFYNQVSWELGGKLKKINGYDCHNALGFYNGRLYEAWYTDEIPISEGPYVFKKLPGLIVELYDKNGYFKFSLISLQKKTEPILIIEDAIDTDYSTFVKTRRNIIENPISKYKGLLNKPLSQEMKKRIIQKAKSKNNFLD